jgi:CBS-domain-containing membrane protein
MRKWTVGEVMTANVVAVPEDATYRTIVDLLAEHRISAVPVVDESRRVVGVVSEADLLYKVEFAGARPERRVFPSRHRTDRQKSEGQVARDVMSSPAVITQRGTPLPAAARLMDEKRVKRLPVVDEGGVLVGIVSRADLLKVHLRTDEELHHDIVDEVLGRTLWLEPHEVQVLVDGGVVTLRGRVDHKSVAGLAVRLTASVAGVVEVVDELTYELDDTDLATSRWYRSHPFSTT